MSNKFDFNPLTGAFDLVPQDEAQYVTVAKFGGMFTTPQAATDSITDASVNKKYVVQIYPGVYVGTLVVKPYISYVGVSTGAGDVVLTSDTTVVSGATQNDSLTTFSRLSIVLTPTTDNQSCFNIAGALGCFDVFTQIVSSSDVSANFYTTVSSVILALSQCRNQLFNSYAGLTKNVTGINYTGAGQFFCNGTSNEFNINSAGAATHCIFEMNNTAEIAIQNGAIVYNNIGASYTGQVRGACVSTASSKVRVIEGADWRFTGGGAGSCSAFFLNSSGANAEVLAAGMVVSINGFTPGQEYSTNTALGDTQKVWLNSSNKNLAKTGAGMAIVTPYDEIHTGFVEWSSVAGNFWSFVPATRAFTLLKRFTGIVKSAPVNCLTATLSGGSALTNNAVNFVYSDDSGALKSTTTPSATLYDSNVPFLKLFCDGTNFLGVKENHPVKVNNGISQVWHDVIGSLLANNGGATVTTLVAASRTVRLIGACTAHDHGINTVIPDSGGLAISFTGFYTNAGGLDFIDPNGVGITALPGKHVATGVITNTPTTSNARIVLRLGVLLDSLNTTTPQYIYSFHTAPFTGTNAANARNAALTAINSGAIAPFPPSVASLEVMQLAYVVITVNGAGGGTLDTAAGVNGVVVSKQVFGANFVAGPAGGSAGLVTTNTTNFTSELGPTETSVQVALDRLDDYDSLLAYTAGKDYYVGNVVVKDDCAYVCSIAIPNSTTWATDKTSFTQVGYNRYANVTAAEAAEAVTPNVCYVQATYTYYQYFDDGGYARDGLYSLNTAAGGTTRWLAIAGQYNVFGINTLGTVTTNTIAERTSAAGVTIDGAVIKDGAVRGLQRFYTAQALAIRAVSTWTERTTPVDNTWVASCWSPELGLFVATAQSGTGNRVMTSPDGISWTIRTSAADIAWTGVCWAPELGKFCACANSAVAQQFMTSSDGITWTIQSGANSNAHYSICWAASLGLFVACGTTAGASHISTSPDGITWTAQATADNQYIGICWSPELNLLCAVSTTGPTAQRVITSPDGVNWTTRTAANNNNYYEVCWSAELGLFAAVSITGTLNRVMTSPDGITWTARTTNDNSWISIAWSPELGLFCACAISGGTDRIMTSPDGITWTTRTSSALNQYNVCWSPELGIFCTICASGSLNRAVTSKYIGSQYGRQELFGSTKPGAVSSSTSGITGISGSASRSDHAHDLGVHTHQDAANGGPIENTGKLITQTHGWTVSKWWAVYWASADTLGKARADVEATSEVVGIAYTVDANTLWLVADGVLAQANLATINADGPGTALVANTCYFLSAVTAGLVSATAPTVVGQIRQPVIIGKSAAAASVATLKTGQVIGGANALLSANLTLAGSAVIQNIASYPNGGGGTIKGTITVLTSGATQGCRVSIDFQKISSTSYNITPTFSASSIVAASGTLTATVNEITGDVSITLPTITGATSANLIYNIDATSPGSLFDSTESIIFQFTPNVTTNLATGSNGLQPIRMPFNFRITEVILSALTTAPTGSAIIANATYGGTPLFSTNISIDATESDSTTAATPYVLATNLLPKGTVLAVNVVQVGSTLPGKGVEIQFNGWRY